MSTACNTALRKERAEIEKLGKERNAGMVARALATPTAQKAIDQYHGKSYDLFYKGNMEVKKPGVTQ
jgi:hypothetical protein